MKLMKIEQKKDYFTNKLYKYAANIKTFESETCIPEICSGMNRDSSILASLVILTIEISALCENCKNIEVHMHILQAVYLANA